MTKKHPTFLFLKLVCFRSESFKDGFVNNVFGNCFPKTDFKGWLVLIFENYYFCFEL